MGEYLVLSGLNEKPRMINRKILYEAPLAELCFWWMEDHAIPVSPSVGVVRVIRNDGDHYTGIERVQYTRIERVKKGK